MGRGQIVVADAFPDRGRMNQGDSAIEEHANGTLLVIKFGLSVYKDGTGGDVNGWPSTTSFYDVDKKDQLLNLIETTCALSHNAYVTTEAEKILKQRFQIGFFKK